MEEEDLDYWGNAEFLEEVIAGFTQPPPPAPAIVPVPAPAPAISTISSSLTHAVQFQPAGHRKQIPLRDPLSYSPPRVLSQRVSGYNDAPVDHSTSSAAAAAKTSSSCSSTRRSDSEKDLEIDRLKKQLERASKQLRDKEKECSQLRKGKSKETQTKNSHAETKGQCATVHASKRTNLEPGVGTSLNDGEINSTTAVGDKRSFKTTGVQADMANHSDLSKKLQDIWGASNFQDPRKNLISELLLACSTDLQILYSFMKINGPPKDKEKDRQAGKNMSNMQSSEALESEKVYQLYSAVTKISYGFVDLKTLFEPLLDLCKAENAVLVDRSLRVLHVLLEHICGFEKKFEDRGTLYAESSRKSQGDTDNALPSWDPNWRSLFELMTQMASKRTEENVKLEAVSIMNIIVMRTDAYTVRETSFVSKEVFETISLLLRKEAGLRVRKEAIHLFYLLLNCPKVLASFDSLHDEKKSSASGNDSEGNLFALETFGLIFEGLADCLTSPRKTTEDLELCRNVIKILALAASSGNSGYELLSNHKLPQDTNFLMLILHILAAELDSESTEVHPNAEIFKARTLLMREILILLNRLVSGSSSSSTILRELTKSRDMASLTVDAATRLSRKKNLLGQPESSVRTMRVTEILDLARIFKRRVFAFLGDNTS